MKKYSSFTDFISKFPDDDACRTFLCDEKWKEGYECKKCGHKKDVKGRTWYYRKCQKCLFDESCTSNTLFHKLKFPLHKAFWIIYQLSTMKKGMSTMEIARQYAIHQETAWFFKRKIQESMKLGIDKLLKEVVQDDEMAIGGRDKGAKGRSHSDKKLVAVTLEVDLQEEKEKPKPIIRSAFADIINNYSTSEIKRVIDMRVSSEAIVMTDNWGSYLGATGDRFHITDYSSNGANFPLLHWHIFNIKNWLRGIHHSITHDHIQSYLDEFHFRFNNRNCIKKCTSKILYSFAHCKWIKRQFLKREVSS